MSYFLALETTTKNCSVAIYKKDKLLYLKEQNEDRYLHSEKLNLFIKESLFKSNVSLHKLEAIFISSGPGSYTGLRIGASTAKGLCYSLDIPLISISTLEAMSANAKKNKKIFYYCPMLDARRDEVYSAIFDSDNTIVRETRADIVDNKIYLNFLNKKVLFFGPGAIKCKSLINHKNAVFKESVFPSAKNLGTLGFKKFLNKDFEDVAYFEPYYLKDFLAGPKK
jgi:tRNA threonylcarbamoyladenosine biosynthesis protein TsaB|tara:strand:+ start:477 stop:1148 length:672 start_codon:yes stop_codon:yes gene_type:complete